MSLYSLAVRDNQLPARIGANFWSPFCQGPDFQNLSLTIPDQALSKGDRVRFVMQVPSGSGSLFDAPGVESSFSGKVPAGLKLLDVHSIDSSHAVAEYEVISTAVKGTGLGLLASVLLVAVAIAIVGIAITALILAIRGDFVGALKETTGLVKWVVIGGIGAGLIVLGSQFLKQRERVVGG